MFNVAPIFAGEDRTLRKESFGVRSITLRAVRESR